MACFFRMVRAIQNPPHMRSKISVSWRGVFRSSAFASASNPCSEGVVIARTFGSAQTALVEPGQADASKPHAPATLEEQIAEAEKGIVRERIWFYRGVVEDSSGKKMRGVKIDIFRSGSG